MGGMHWFRRDDAGRTNAQTRSATEPVYLRRPTLRDYDAWARLRAASRPFLQPWEPSWGETELSLDDFRRRLARYAEDGRAGTGVAFLVFRASDSCLVGGLSISNIRRSVSYAATIGYWIGTPFQRQGYMSSALRQATRFGFGDLGLHRLEAAVMPHNTPSRTLLEKCGFNPEGLARGLLFINGAWEDHVIYARLSNE